LCYIATLTFDYNKNKVKAIIKPKAIGSDNPMSHLRGKQIFVSVTTSLMNGSPLILSGAGQGGRSGAAGLLGDVIGVAQRLRGRA
jgi:homoserine dehydrogenase